MIKKIAYEMKTGEKVHQEPEKMERKYIRGLKTGELKTGELVHQKGLKK